ncbi:DUF3422 family protein [Paracoccus luteus]|uniref:DUF3422 family protein n=1 Tax=Paracoccus luteus TaxID=2508543 RepID=UPI00107028B8|nr:DUF3422 domain-containing protein [Paracoccus luteus]
MDPVDHPLRYAMVNELHARPSPRLDAPATAVLVAFKEPRDAANRDRAADIAHLAALAERHGAPAPQHGAGHYAAMLGRHQLRWEGHTEFVSYACFAPGLPDRPFDPSAAAIFSRAWQRAAPGRRVVAAMIQIDVLPDDVTRVDDRLASLFAVDGLSASSVLDGQGVIATDFRIDAAGWMRFAVFVHPEVGPGRIGRLVQRLLELETYRAMSMLGLPRVLSLTGRLNALEPRLTALTAPDDTRPPDLVLADLLAVSSELEAAASQHQFRFGATAAYEAIAADRIETLRETRFQGRQTLSEFMTRRFEPAMRTVRSAERRLAEMLDRAARAGELLRTRVDVQRSAQNQALLERMDRRADLQLRLQHTVEGLSVVAISYYAVGLIGYAAYPLAEASGIDKALLVAGATPLVVLAVWWGMRRVRAALHRAAGGHAGHGDL